MNVSDILNFVLVYFFFVIIFLLIFFFLCCFVLTIQRFVQMILNIDAIVYFWMFFFWYISLLNVHHIWMDIECSSYFVNDLLCRLFDVFSGQTSWSFMCYETIYICVSRHFLMYTIEIWISQIPTNKKKMCHILRKATFPIWKWV